MVWKRVLIVVWGVLWSAFPPPVHSAEKCGFVYFVAGSGKTPAALPPRYFDEKSAAATTTRVFTSPSGHFRIHYETDGYNAIPSYDRNGNGTPDYLEFVASSFDRAWRVEIDSLGFRPPPDANGNPKTVYDVYCQNLAGQELFGYTLFDPTQDIPALPGLNYTSVIYISTQFTFVVYENVDPITRDSMAIAVTAAHEFNHALQLGYRIWGNVTASGQLDTPDLWFIESSATYMEEVVANEVNDYYRYLPEFYATTNLSLTATPDLDRFAKRMYGEAIWFIQMGKRWGTSVTRQIWERITSFPAARAMAEFLREKGESLPEAVYTLAEWMYFSGQNARIGQYFPEAAQYPTPPVDFWLITNSDSYSSYPIPLETNSFAFVKAAIPWNGEVAFVLPPVPVPNIAHLLVLDDPVTVLESGTLFRTRMTVGAAIPFAISHSSEETFESSMDTLQLVVNPGAQYHAVAPLSLFPALLNVPEGQVVVNLASVGQRGTITVFDAAGHAVISRPYVSSNSTLAFSFRPFLSNMRSGVYIIRVAIEAPRPAVKLGKLMVVK